MMLLSFNNVYYSYKSSGSEVLKGISFKLDKKEKVALLGLNGSGKSTLLLLTNGLLLPSSGSVEVGNNDTKGGDLSEIRRKVGMVFQNSDDQLFMPSVKEDVSFGLRNMKLPEEEIERKVKEALRLTGTEHLAQRAPYELSGGQKKSVSIATVLPMEPELLVLDEPTAGLDYKGVDNFIKLMQTLPHAILMTTHDLEVAKQICNRAILLQDGKISFDGRMEDLPYPL